MTLLEQAHKSKKGTAHPDGEVLAMAIAVIEGEITVTQAEKALYPDSKTRNNLQASARLWTGLLEGLRDGRIRMVIQQ